MADDEVIDDEFDEGLEAEDIDEDDLEVDGEDGLAVDDEDDDDLVGDEAATDEDEDEAAAAPKAKKKREDEEDDEEEADPDDVEADLDRILKDRIAASEEDEEEEDLEDQEPRTTAETAEGVQPKKANEFMCTGCFLLVNAAQFGPPGHLECPVGESVCPSIRLVEKQYQKARK
jgi:hypothetical protein